MKLIKRAVKGTIDGKLLLGLPEDMSKAVRKAARKEGISAGEWIRAAIAMRLEA